MKKMSYYDAALDLAIDVLGTKERAAEWLEKMSASLGSAPKDLLATQEGFERVRRHIHSVEIALDTD